MDYNKILQIPERLIARQTLTKIFFTRNFDMTSPEKKLLKEVIVNMEIMSQISPDKSNVRAVRTNEYYYDDILIIVCKITNIQFDKSKEKCIELIQSYIPRQILLIVEDDDNYIINVCDKRVNQIDNKKVVIEQYVSTDKINKLYLAEKDKVLFNAFAYNEIDKTSIQTAYGSYIQAVINYKSASLTGRQIKKNYTNTEDSLKDLLLLEECENKITYLKNSLKTANLIREQVDLNMKIQVKKKEIEVIKDRL